MGWKSLLLKPYASLLSRKIKRQALSAVEIQEKTLLKNVRFAQNTEFGKEHDFNSINSYLNFKQRVPLRSYTELKPYIDQVLNGDSSVLWPGTPKYIVGTAGTTGGIKHIPLSRESMPYHMQSAIKAGINYAYTHNHMDIFDGKLIFLTGTPALEKIGNIPLGRLSGIVNHEIPSFLKGLQVPSFKTNSISDWNKKIEQIALETYQMDLRMISGIPPWIVMYLEKLLEVSGKSEVMQLFPNLKMIIHGGVNYKPYHPILLKLIGKEIDFVETYPSTEAFVAFQDKNPEDGLLLNVDGGTFFEYVPVEEISLQSPTRLSLKEVELDKSYALIINNNAGLWGSIIGDIITFVSLNPFRIKMTGRTSQFISAFGEHIVESDVNEVMSRVLQNSDAVVREFTVAPRIQENDKRHVWYIEFEKTPSSIQKFKELLNEEMMKQNFHYHDLVKGKVIEPLELIPLDRDVFHEYLTQQGKIGGQNKIPRISNTMAIATHLLSFQNNR